MMLALLRQLVKVVGVKESDLAIGDTLGYFPNPYYKMLHDEFPQVHYLDHQGKFDRTAVKRAISSIRGFISVFSAPSRLCVSLIL